MHDDSLVDLILYAAMAPLSHNTQPWVIRLECALKNLVIAAENADAQVTLGYFFDDAGTAATRDAPE